MKSYLMGVAAAALLCAPATAATLVDTGEPLQTGGILVSGQYIAGLFTLDAAATITSVEGFIGGNGGTGNISIFTGGVDPAFSGLLFNSSFALAAAPAGAWQGVFGQNWNLAAGQYWAVFNTDGFNSMRQGAPNPLSQYATSTQLAGPWSQQGSRLGVGVRITNDVAVIGEPPVTGAVPEPATWAMMMLGFAAIGGSMRSGRRTTAFSYS